ncbi:4552_t:CDS:1 [Ambispora gerdemannii]|uniref:4552_t:CDS:1 n=1 Tax=Ambispora gerdemannii TaxID=144530 RepID=A0A9N9FGE8_9GLOM|nr:4552_t:CDS:1 [Ambispora gerdemannii]
MDAFSSALNKNTSTHSQQRSQQIFQSPLANSPTSSATSKLVIQERDRQVKSDVTRLLKDMLERTGTMHFIYVTASYNNTIITLTDSKHNPLVRQSGGTVGFKKSHRGGYEAAHQTAVAIATKAKEKNIKITDVEIVLKGFGPGRDAAFKALTVPENGWTIKRVTDATPIPFNGCRPRKTRRI